MNGENNDTTPVTIDHGIETMDHNGEMDTIGATNEPHSILILTRDFREDMNKDRLVTDRTRTTSVTTENSEMKTMPDTFATAAKLNFPTT